MWDILLQTVPGILLMLAVVSGSLSAEVPQVEQTNGQTVRISSGRCPGFSEVDARREAESSAAKEMVTALQNLAETWAGITLTERQAYQEWQWLLRQPGVKQNVQQTGAARDYGWVAEQEITLFLPNVILEQWVNRLRSQRVTRWQVRLAGGLASLGLCVAALLGMVILDRWTRGYYRGLVLGGMSLGLVMVLAALWVWIITLW